MRECDLCCANTPSSRVFACVVLLPMHGPGREVLTGGTVSQKGVLGPADITECGLDASITVGNVGSCKLRTMDGNTLVMSPEKVWDRLHFLPSSSSPPSSTSTPFSYSSFSFCLPLSAHWSPKGLPFIKNLKIRSPAAYLPSEGCAAHLPFKEVDSFG